MSNSSSEKKPAKMTPGTAAIVGGIAGALEITAAYPIEFTKVIMQLYSKYNQLGMSRVIQHTLKQDGFFGLYKGYNVMVTAGVPKAYVRFGVFEYLTQNVLTTPSLLNTTVCGAIAGALEGLIVHTPTENLKVKLIHDRFKNPPQFRNMFHGAYRICKDQGVKGITAGAAICMCKEGSNHAIRFPLFFGLQKLFSPYFNNNVLRDVVAGGLTGVLCVLMNQPIDTIKTNMQGLHAYKYKNTIDCVKQIVRGEGVLGLYKGLKPRVARVAIEVSVTFASFNMIRDSVLKYMGVTE